MNLQFVLNAMKMVGAELPAFKSLFEHALGTFSTHDQAKLKSAYEAEMSRSDDAHKAAQDALK